MAIRPPMENTRVVYSDRNCFAVMLFSAFCMERPSVVRNVFILSKIVVPMFAMPIAINDVPKLLRKFDVILNSDLIRLGRTKVILFDTKSLSAMKANISTFVVLGMHLPNCLAILLISATPPKAESTADAAAAAATATPVGADFACFDSLVPGVDYSFLCVCCMLLISIGFDRGGSVAVSRVPVGLSEINPVAPNDFSGCLAVSVTGM